MCIETQILNDGLGLMLTGMGTVFSFLVVLWCSVSIMSKVVGKLNEIFPEIAAQSVKVIVKQSDDEAIAVAIAMAKYRN